MDISHTMDWPSASSSNHFHIVGLGASAGGLESLELFFKNMPADSGMAFVVTQHLSPDFKSMMDELLARHTAMPIHVAEENMEVEPNHIYLLPRMKEMIISEGRLHLTDKDSKQGLTLPIDHFFRSLAQDCGEQAVAVILSGTGSDGSRGIKDIHEAGGLVLCEDYKSAKFDGMPLSAQETGVVDLVLNANEMPTAILDYIQSQHRTVKGPIPIDAEPLEGVEAVFDLLRREYDIDFSHYKPTTVSRRIERRLSLLHIRDLEEYVAKLRHNPGELISLYKDLLIGVTKFFRDTETFEILERDIIPGVLERVPDDEEIRVWVAGCATGEEPYSLGILFVEALEKAKRPIKLKIFATDVHKESLELAGHGIYDEDRLAEVSISRRKKFFIAKQDCYQVTPELRQLIVFAQHNVIKDAPFTNLDLISCRNLLIYLQPQAQKKALSLFHFGLKTGGSLLLGSSETPGELADEFETVNEHHKLYRKRRDIRLPADMRLPLSRRANSLRGSVVAPRAANNSADASLMQIYDQLLDKFVPPSLLINHQRELIESYGGAEKLLHLKGRRISHDLLDLLETETKTSVAGALNRVIRHGQPLSFTGVRLKSQDGQHTYRLEIEPIKNHKTSQNYYLITLHPLVEHAPSPLATTTAVNAEEMSIDQIRHLEDELKNTKENLQVTIEELETSNEEMQATNQELVASNEELQSTNEELHSVNEELYTVNAEHQKKIQELAELNQDMEHLLRCTEVATIFLDPKLCIRKFTPQVATIFDLVDQDIGRRIGTFSHRICYEKLIDDLNEVLRTGRPRECEVRDLDGRCYFMRILPYRIAENIDGVVLSLIDISVLDDARGRISHLSAIVESSEDAIIGIDLNGTITSWNAGAESLYGYKANQVIGENISILIPDDQNHDPQLWYDQIENGEHPDHFEVDRVTQSGKSVHVSLSMSPIRNRDGKIIGASAISRDISERKQAEQARAYLSAIVESSQDAIVGKTLDGKVTSWNRGAEQLYGYTAEEMLGQPITKLVPPDRFDDLDNILRQIAKGAKLENFETVRLRKDGSRVDISLTISPIISSKGKLIGASAIARDITQLKKTRDEKEASEQRIRLLLDSTAEAIYGMDIDGKCQFVNSACLRLLGFDTADDLLGQDMHELIHYQHPDGTTFHAHECSIYKAFQNGRKFHSEEEVFFRKDGSHFHAEVWSHPMIAGNSENIGAVVTFLDITARKEALNTLREESRRRELFLAMLSHELRNPLSAIRTAARILKAPDINPEADKEARRIVERQTSQMTRLLDDLLDVSRITQDKIRLKNRVIDLRETVEDAVQSVKSLAYDCEIEIQVQLPQGPLNVIGDLARIEQIQANLLSNAIKYSPPGETVLIQLSQHEQHALIRVIDNGAGIAPEKSDSIFDMFVQVNETLGNANGGMGVGLTLVRRLVEMHGGTVQALSEGVGRGSTFEVRLPLTRESKQETVDLQVSTQQPHLIKRLAIVEDRDENRIMLKMLLELEGLQVIDADNGQNGIDLIKQKKPDAAIIDIGLPDIDGYEVVRRLRKQIGDQIVLIALSGYGQPQDIKNAKIAGFDHYLVKPLQPEKLLEILKQYAKPIRS